MPRQPLPANRDEGSNQRPEILLFLQAAGTKNHRRGAWLEPGVVHRHTRQCLHLAGDNGIVNDGDAFSTVCGTCAPFPRTPCGDADDPVGSPEGMAHKSQREARTPLCRSFGVHSQMLRHDVVLANDDPRLAAGDASGAKGKQTGSVAGGEDNGGSAMPQVSRQPHETLRHPHPGATGVGPGSKWDVTRMCQSNSTRLYGFLIRKIHSFCQPC